MTTIVHRGVSGRFVVSITSITCSLSVVQDFVLGQGCWHVWPISNVYVSLDILFRVS